MIIPLEFLPIQKMTKSLPYLLKLIKMNQCKSSMTAIAPLVIYLPGHVPYESDKAIPYKYNATFIENGKEIPLPSVVNIADVSRVTTSGRVFNRATKNVEKPSEEAPHKQDNHPTNATQAKKNDEILKLIQR